VVVVVVMRGVVATTESVIGTCNHLIFADCEKVYGTRDSEAKG
jgi:hypothetical protein